jgi:hypothetical protein
MVSASQIRNELAISLAGAVSLDAFEEWFVRNTWNIQNEGSKAAEVLTFEIEELFSEYTNGHISEGKLRGLLSQVIHAETEVLQVVYAAPARVPVYSFNSAAPVALARIPVQL